MYYAERFSCPDVKAMAVLGTFEQYEKECEDLNTGWSRNGELCCNKYGSALDFVSIRGSFWWSVVTMTTVGYGDNVPRTLLGRLVGFLAMISGIVLISLPVAIVGSKFQIAYEMIEEQKRSLQNIPEDEREAYLEEHSHGNAAVDSSLLADIIHATEEDAGKKGYSSEHSVPKAIASRAEGHDMGAVQPLLGQQPQKSFKDLRTKLRLLEKNPKLSDKSLDELYLLLEMFDHIEKVEQQLHTLHIKDAALDASLRKEFASLSRAYDLTLREDSRR